MSTQPIQPIQPIQPNPPIDGGLFGNVQSIGTGHFEFPKPLADKYRPMQIKDFIGLAKIKTMLSNFATKPSSCGWVFCGPSGTGKTSMAQALCAALGGEFRHLPSGKCDMKAIDELVRNCWYAPISPWRNHVFLSGEICIGDSGDFDDG